MDELEPISQSLKKLLDSERVLPKVPAAAKARMFAKLSGELFGPGGGGGGGGDGGAQPHAAASPVAQAASWGSAAVAKLVVGVGLASFAVGGAVGVGVHAALQVPLPPTPPPVTVAAVLAEPAEPAEPPRAPEPPPPAAMPPAPVVAKSAARPDTLGAERSLVDQARSALARKDYASALGALEEHEHKFAHGQLTEERAALKVVALSGLGRAADAHQAAVDFRKRFPESLLMPLVDNRMP